MSISDTSQAKKYASIAEVAAAQAKNYASELENAPDYAEQAAASAQEAAISAASAINAQNATVGYAVAAANSASESAASAMESADAAQVVVDAAIGGTVRAPEGESLSALPAAASRENTVLITGLSGDIGVKPISDFAVLDGDGKVPLSMIPASAITEVFPVSSQAEMLALDAQPGDVAKRTDKGLSYILMQLPASTLANWIVITDDVLAQLALTTGAGQVNTTSNQSVQDVLDANGSSITAIQGNISTINGQISALNTTVSTTGTTTSLSKESASTRKMIRVGRPHRVSNKTVPQDATKKYDHFGTMDRKADGVLYQMFRRGATHTDNGVTVYTEMQSSGSWSTPVTIVSASGKDCRGASGGTAPDGAMYCAGAYTTSPGVFAGAFVYRSQDYGATWTKVADISNPEAGTNSAVIPYGKIASIGGKLVIPAYTKLNDFTPTLTYLQSTDNGDTWSIGPAIFTGVDYNEAYILELGDGAALCVARTGDGTVQSDGSRRLHQFISGDGGATWADQGQVIGPDASDEIGWQLVSPSLSLFYSPGGTPYVLLAYTARVGSVRYRTCTVTNVTSGASNWSNFNIIRTISSEFESGYQSQVVEDDIVYMNYYATTTNDSVSVATQMQFNLGCLPDYDSGLFASAVNTTYTKAHNFGAMASSYIMEWSIDAVGKSTVIEVPCSLRWDSTSSSNKGVGATIQGNQSGFTIRTGTTLIPGSYFGSPAGTDYNGQYMRIKAWK